MKSSPSTLVLILLSFMLTIPVLAGTLSREETLSLPAGGLERLILSNGSGLLECVAEDRENIHVELVFKVKSRKRDKAQRLLEESSLSVSREAGELRLAPDASSSRVNVEMLVRLPFGLEVNAEVGSGDLYVRDLRGPLYLEAGSGRIDGRDLVGDVKVKLGSGEISLRDVKGAVRIQAGSGDIKLKRIVSCELKASSGNVEINSVLGLCRVKTNSGDVYIRKVAGPTEIETGSGDIEASGLMDRVRSESNSGDQEISGLGRPGQNLRIRSSSGDLDLSFLIGASYALELETTSGDVDFRLPIALHEVTRRRLEGSIGEASDRARIETSSGDIRICATEERP
jgi:DUF4097 and DUF4098 domain-containing protein YvlB